MEDESPTQEVGPAVKGPGADPFALSIILGPHPPRSVGCFVPSLVKRNSAEM